MCEYKFLWFIVENGWDRIPNETLYDSYKECYQNLTNEYPEYLSKAKICLVEIDETEIVTILYTIKEEEQSYFRY